MKIRNWHFWMPLRTCKLAAIGALSLLIGSCGQGGSSGNSQTSTNSRDPLHVQSAVLAANVVTLDPATNGLVMIAPGVFFSKGATALKVDDVFLLDGLAFKISFVDAAPGGSTTVYNRAADLG